MLIFISVNLTLYFKLLKIFNRLKYFMLLAYENIFKLQKIIFRLVKFSNNFKNKIFKILVFMF